MKNRQRKIPKFRLHCKLLIIVLFRNVSGKSVLYRNSSYSGTQAEFSWKTCEIFQDSLPKHIFDGSPEWTTSRSSAPRRGATHGQPLLYLNIIPQLTIHFHLWSTWFMFGLLSQNYLTYNKRIVDQKSKTTATAVMSDGRIRCIDIYERSLWNSNCFFYTITFNRI
jgi:hypothetical protein